MATDKLSKMNLDQLRGYAIGLGLDLNQAPAVDEKDGETGRRRLRRWIRANTPATVTVTTDDTTPAPEAPAQPLQVNVPASPAPEAPAQPLQVNVPASPAPEAPAAASATSNGSATGSGAVSTGGSDGNRNLLPWIIGVLVVLGLVLLFAISQSNQPDTVVQETPVVESELTLDLMQDLCRELIVQTGSVSGLVVELPEGFATCTSILAGNPIYVDEMVSATDTLVEVEEEAAAATDTPEEGDEESGAKASAFDPAKISWQSIDPALFSETFTVNGERRVLFLGSHYAVTTKNGRYEAVESAPAGETDDDWCGPDQFDCPAHLLLRQYQVPRGDRGCLTAELDISDRVIVTNTCDEPTFLHYNSIFNHETRSDDELMDDYRAAAAGQTPSDDNRLGLFLAVKEPTMKSAKLWFGEYNYDFGTSCWDCLADTGGPDRPVVALNDEDLIHFGPSTPVFKASAIPGLVLPIPSPEEMPELEMEVYVELQPGADLVLWYGVYNVDTMASSQLPATVDEEVANEFFSQVYGLE